MSASCAGAAFTMMVIEVLTRLEPSSRLPASLMGQRSVAFRPTAALLTASSPPLCRNQPAPVASGPRVARPWQPFSCAAAPAKNCDGA